MSRREWGTVATSVIASMLAVATTAAAVGPYLITSSRQIRPGVIQVSHLSKKAQVALRGAKGPPGPPGGVAVGGISTGDIHDGAVTSAKLADGAVTATKLGQGSVGTSALADGAITRTKLADGSVSGAAIAINSITPEKVVASRSRHPQARSAASTPR